MKNHYLGKDLEIVAADRSTSAHAELAYRIVKLAGSSFKSAQRRR
jgi:hypothetical protein